MVKPTSSYLRITANSGPSFGHFDGFNRAIPAEGMTPEGAWFGIGSITGKMGVCIDGLVLYQRLDIAPLPDKRRDAASTFSASDPALPGAFTLYTVTTKVMTCQKL